VSDNSVSYSEPSINKLMYRTLRTRRVKSKGNIVFLFISDGCTQTQISLVCVCMWVDNTTYPSVKSMYIVMIFFIYRGLFTANYCYCLHTQKNLHMRYSCAEIHIVLEVTRQATKRHGKPQKVYIVKIIYKVPLERVLLARYGHTIFL
jgi:hypothetical protein